MARRLLEPVSLAALYRSKHLLEAHQPFHKALFIVVNSTAPHGDQLVELAAKHMTSAFPAWRGHRPSSVARTMREQLNKLKLHGVLEEVGGRFRFGDKFNREIRRLLKND